jgi:Uma2 family endonuclease
MSAAPVTPAGPDTDQFVYLRVGWDGYEQLLAMRGESSVPRITYLEGVVELMSPSRHHEVNKKALARLLEAWAEDVGVHLEGYGSWTLKDSKEERGAEADECYTVGRVAESDQDRPDIAIEVIWTSGGIDKLEVYRKLGVREIWFFKGGKLSFFVLRGERYEELVASELLPNADPALFERCMTEPDQTSAVRALRAALRSRD